MLISTYVSSYLILSRVGYRVSRDAGLRGFSFVLPTTEQRTRLNRALNFFYSPLILIDCLIGTGEQPAKEPLVGISK
jgi:hypothetical protein